ncbi:hypothetical protein [Simkania sp.]|uniref:hypothetical protein n=1 Tax=Simkania sp. TaxID=34094 RepID=UPI003B51B55C
MVNQVNFSISLVAGMSFGVVGGGLSFLGGCPTSKVVSEFTGYSVAYTTAIYMTHHSEICKNLSSTAKVITFNAVVFLTRAAISGGFGLIGWATVDLVTLLGKQFVLGVYAMPIALPYLLPYAAMVAEKIDELRSSYI